MRSLILFATLAIPSLCSAADLPEPNGKVDTLTVYQITELQTLSLTPFGPQMTTNTIMLSDKDGNVIHTIQEAFSFKVQSIGPEFWILVGDEQLNLIIRSSKYLLTVVKDFHPPPAPIKGT